MEVIIANSQKIETLCFDCGPLLAYANENVFYNRFEKDLIKFESRINEQEQ